MMNTLARINRRRQQKLKKHLWDAAILILIVPIGLAAGAALAVMVTAAGIALPLVLGAGALYVSLSDGRRPWRFGIEWPTL